MKWRRDVVVMVFVVALSRAWSACTYDFTIGTPTPDGGGAASGDASTGSPPSTRTHRSCQPSCECSSTESCELTCASGAVCSPTCSGASDCTVKCASATCKIRCGAGAKCAIDCKGGVCSTECDGECVIDCASGFCNCEGAGCP